MTIRVTCSPGERRVAVTDATGLVDYAIWRPGRPDGVGDVHRGRVAAVVPGLAGAFVALADGEDGFLPDTAGAAGRGVGDMLAVCVTRSAQGGKGRRLAAAAVEPGAGPPALLRPGPNPVELLAARHAGPVLVDDPGVAASLRAALGDRVTAGPAWDEEIVAAAEELAGRTAALPGGLRATVEPTAALVAIDVDMAGATAGREAKASRQEAANRAALPALARQIRLRNLSGAILVDLAGMSSKRRAGLTPAFRAALAADPLEPRLLGFTAGGLAEIHRSRRYPPLHELLAGPLAAGLAALRRVAQDADPAAPPWLRASPAVASALAADGVGLSELAARLGRPLVVRSDPALAGGTWMIEENARG